MTISKPLVGDEKRIAMVPGIPSPCEGVNLEQIAAHEEKWRNAAFRKGCDSIPLLSPKCYTEWKSIGKIPRSLELNILNVSVDGGDSLSGKQ